MGVRHPHRVSSDRAPEELVQIRGVGPKRRAEITDALKRPC
jgi:hypothetical protein